MLIAAKRRLATNIVTLDTTLWPDVSLSKPFTRLLRFANSGDHAEDRVKTYETFHIARRRTQRRRGGAGSSLLRLKGCGTVEHRLL